MKNDIRDLSLVLDSKVKLVVIESWDESRVLETLNGLALNRGISLATWTVTSGLECLGSIGSSDEDIDSCEPEVALKRVKADSRPNLYAFCDFHPYLVDKPKVVRLVKEIAMAEGDHKPTLVFVSHALDLPAELQRYAARFTLALPGEEELLRIVHEEARRWSGQNRGAQVQADKAALEMVVSNLRGMSHAEARLLARKVIWDDGAITLGDLPTLNKTKFQILNLEGVLSLESDAATFQEVGGLSNIKQWIKDRQKAFLEREGADVPKGVLLVGVQGGGKSLAAKAVAGQWGLPLLRLDFACLYNKFFGETERNLREALRIAEQMSPSVLWMDEVEKGLASGLQDDGVSQRMLGTLLTWMAERKQPVFIVATANAIECLPPELLRKGRFDEMFFVDLPKADVREEIFRIHLLRRELPVEQFDLSSLAAASEGFSGAEIEQVVVAAVYRSQAHQRTVDQDALLKAMHATAPLSIVMAEKMAELRNWAVGRTVMAD